MFFLRRIFAAFFALAAVLSAGCGAGTGPRELSGYDPQPGDIVFRRGSGAKSTAVVFADTSGMYSHAGIVVATDSGYYAVHMVPGERERGESEDFIKSETLEDFFSGKRAETGAAARFADSLECSPLAAAHALRLLGERMIFDHEYDLGDTSRMYCTEFVWHVFRLAGRDVTRGSRSEVDNFGPFSGTYIFPSDIYSNGSLITVYQF